MDFDVDSLLESNERILNGDGAFEGSKYGEKGELILTWKVSSYIYSLTITYEPPTLLTDERIRIKCFMPDEHWFSIGFGDSMINTDMIAWTTKGEESYVTDHYSTAKQEPGVDLE